MINATRKTGSTHCHVEKEETRGRGGGVCVVVARRRRCSRVGDHPEPDARRNEGLDLIVDQNSHHAHKTASVFARRPILTGFIVGLGSLSPHFLLPPRASLGFAAVLVALIAGIYFGFAVINGLPRNQFVEFSVAGAFAVAGLLGLLLWPILLPLAYFGHAQWDFAHHNRARLSLVAIPQWYVPWCVVIDVIIGAGLLAVWSDRGIL
jgi:hypothetical protein